ncbi:hypothetical protein Tco_0230551, partial [Tanacetum coccineum]
LKEDPAPTGETTAPLAPKTAKQLAARRNQERVKSILLLAIPDEYLLKFHNVADAKSLWEVVWTDIQEKDKKKAKNKQNQARNGKDKVNSKPKSVKVRKSTQKKSKVNQVKKNTT